MNTRKICYGCSARISQDRDEWQGAYKLVAHQCQRLAQGVIDKPCYEYFIEWYYKKLEKYNSKEMKMNLDKIVEATIRQIEAGIDAANKELNYNAAYMPREIEFDITHESNKSIKFKVLVEKAFHRKKHD